jgi:acetyl-CoA acetyltransferase
MTQINASLRAKAAMVAAATAGTGVAPAGAGFMELAGQATLKALAQVGLSVRDVDGVFGASMSRLLWPIDFAEYMGIKPHFCDGTQIGGASFQAHALSAALALEAGLCSVALIVFGATTRSKRGPWPTLRDADLFLDPYQAEGLHTYAMAAQRHIHEYGTTRDQLSAPAVSARQWAGLNPEAFKRDPLTLEAVAQAKMIATPLTVADCCLVTDGAAAIIMTRADRAVDLVTRPAYLLGAGVALDGTNPALRDTLTTTVATQSSKRAYAMAGVAPPDVSMLQLYDAFTINVLLFLEDLGFCAKGEGGPMAASGVIAPGGRLPTNTNGGGLSCVHPGMYGSFMLAETFAQVSQSAGGRQVGTPNVVVCHGNGGNLSAQVTTIWGSGDAV